MAAKHLLTVGENQLSLEVHPQVFVPTTTSDLLLQAATIPKGGRVLDIGCGIGVIAIAAALRGAGRVTATDVMPEACDIAQRNVETAGVNNSVEVLRGDLYGAVAGREFDLIICDVSGIAADVARVSPWYPESIPVADLGGTDLVNRAISGSHHHLSRCGTFLFPTLSLSDFRTTEALAGKSFPQLRLLREVRIPMHPVLVENLPLLERARRQGRIDFGQKGSRFFWTLRILEGRQA